MKIRLALAALAALTFTAAAQAPTYKREVPAKLLSQATITEDSAVKLAMKAVPTGTIKSLELEKEKGKLIWSMDMTVPGKSGIDEVNIEAVTGAVLPVQHEAN